MASPAHLEARKREHGRIGLCLHCGAEAAEGRKLCAEHLRYHRSLKKEQRAERRAAGLCQVCGLQPPVAKWACTECLAKARERMSQLYARRKKQREAALQAHHRYVERILSKGLCVRCRERDRMPDRQLCRPCTEAAAEAYLELRTQRRTEGLCKCGREPRPGFATCERCAAAYRKQAARARKRRAALGQCRQCQRKRLKTSPFCRKHKKEHTEGKRRRTRRKRALMESGAAAGTTTRRAA